MFDAYWSTIQLIERLHRQFLDLLKTELEQNSIYDINNIQALILYNIGTSSMTVGDLTSRGHYLGSNVSYNVKKMVENDYMIQERSPHDRRSSRVRLSDKGLDLKAQLQSLFQRHAELLETQGPSKEDLNAASLTLENLESFWRNG